jgi:hypothetical protein
MTFFGIEHPSKINKGVLLKVDKTMPPNVLSFDLMTVVGDELGTIRIGNDGIKLVIMISFANGIKEFIHLPIQLPEEE